MSRGWMGGFVAMLAVLGALLLLAERSGRFRVKAITEIGDFNARFGTAFSDEDYDTVGGLVLAHFGRLPQRGESINIEGYNFQVLRADSRKVHSLLVETPKPKEPQ